MIYLYILLGIVIIAAISVAALSFWQFRTVCFPKVIPTEKTIQIEHDKGLTDKSEYTKFLADNKFQIALGQQKICAAWARAKNQKSSKVVIICHGYLYSMVESFKYAKAFNALGYDALIYDQPSHGESDKTVSGKRIAVGMGYLEAKTLVKIVDYVLAEYSDVAPFIGVMGESMGGETAILAAEMDARIKFVVAHCVPKTITDGFKFTLTKRKKKWQILLLPFADFWTKKLCGYSYKDVDSVKAVQNLTIPMLFCHGDKDNTVPYHNSQTLYDEKKEGIKAFYLARGARHDTIMTVNPQKYMNELSSFMDSAETYYNLEERT